MDDFKPIKYSINNYEKTILSKFLTLSNPKIILELGVDKGSTTKFILDFLSENKFRSKLFGFDFKNIVKNLSEKDLKIKKYLDNNELELISGILPSSLKSFLKKYDFKIDFVFIDATGDFKNVFGELSLLWPHLSQKGFIVCHYHKERLHYAIEYFSKKNKVNFIPLNRKYSDSAITASIVVLSKPQFKYSLFKRLYYQYNLNEVKGYYFIKSLLNFFK